MKIKLVVILGLFFIPLTSLADKGNDKSANSQLKVCYNENFDKLYVSGRCKGNSVRLLFEDFSIASFGLIPSGVTVMGVVGGRYYANLAGDSFDNLASLPNQTVQVFDSENDVQVANTLAVNDECGGLTCLTVDESVGASRCTGSPESPTAPAGVVCIYPTTNVNAESLFGFNIVNTASSNIAIPTTGAVGFGLSWQATATGNSAVEGVWAYQAP